MTDKKLQIRNSTSEFLIFTKQAGEDAIEVRVQDENVWLTQKLIAKLFEVQIPTINEHLKNIFSTDELDENSVVRNFLITATDGKNYNTKHYNLEVIMYLDYAEDQAENGIPMTMKDWAEKLNAFLKFNQKDILEDFGKVSAEVAKSFAESEFQKYRVLQDRNYISDFDRLIQDTSSIRKKD